MLSDLQYYKENSPSNSYLAVLLNPCYYAVVLYRISNKLYRTRLGILAKLVWFANRIIFAVDIDYRASIGKRFMLIHGIGVVIGKNVVIGDNVRVYQGVTLGGSGKERLLNGKVIDQPIILDNCVLYTNSCVFGPVIIGNGTKVKACKVITCDINVEEQI